METKCPCKQCISFAICNSMIKEMVIPDITNHSVFKDCSDLHNYIGANNKDAIHTDTHRKEINITRKIFGVPPMITRKTGSYENYEN